MGVFSWPGPGRSRRAHRSIRYAFGTMVAAPIASLVLIWVLTVTVTLGRIMSERGISPQSHHHLVEFTLVIGTGLVVLVVSAAAMGWFTARLSTDLSELETSARHVADDQLPKLVEQLRLGQRVTTAAGQPIRLRTKTTEIARTAAAITRLQQTAVAAASGEASLRTGIGQVFVSLARRNQSLLQRQLRLIDALEQKATDPAALADLFPLDHLTTRMRRHAEGLIILSGAAPGRSWSEPVPVIDVLRGAVAEVEDYKRVTVITSAEDAVAGSAVADMIHLLAELIENATLFSPSGMRVEVRAERVTNGFAVEIEDRGLGIKPAQLNVINQRLANPPDFDLANADQLGLFVVGKLAARHGVRVSLRPSPYGGTSAIVLMPNSIVVSVNEKEAGAARESRAAISGPPTLELRSVEAPEVTEPQPVRPSLPVSSADRLTGPADTYGLAAETSGLEPVSRGGPTEGTGDLPPRSQNGFTEGSEDAVDGFALEGLSPGGLLSGLSAPQPAAEAPPTAPPPVPTYRGLPRRIRQASLSPHLRDDSPAVARPLADAGSPPSGLRTPEQARDLVASMQMGWQRGRETDGPAGSGSRTRDTDGPSTGSQGAGSQEDRASTSTGDAEPATRVADSPTAATVSRTRADAKAGHRAGTRGNGREESAPGAGREGSETPQGEEA